MVWRNDKPPPPPQWKKIFCYVFLFMVMYLKFFLNGSWKAQCPLTKKKKVFFQFPILKKTSRNICLNTKSFIKFCVPFYVYILKTSFALCVPTINLIVAHFMFKFSILKYMDLVGDYWHICLKHLHSPVFHSAAAHAFTFGEIISGDTQPYLPFQICI